MITLCVRVSESGRFSRFSCFGTSSVVIVAR